MRTRELYAEAYFAKVAWHSLLHCFLCYCLSVGTQLIHFLFDTSPNQFFVKSLISYGPLDLHVFLGKQPPVEGVIEKDPLAKLVRFYSRACQL